MIDSVYSHGEARSTQLGAALVGNKYYKVIVDDYRFCHVISYSIISCTKESCKVKLSDTNVIKNLSKDEISSFSKSKKDSILSEIKKNDNTIKLLENLNDDLKGLLCSM